MFKPLIAMAMLGALATACSAPVPLSTTQLTEKFGQDSVFASTREGGNRMAEVVIQSPDEGGYQVQATVHRWVDNDIFEYRATLKVWNGTAYVDLATPMTVTIPRKGTGAKTKAVFTNLKQGTKYQVSLAALGNVGGTVATTTLNTQNATASVFDFTAAQDVEDTLAASMKISFDPVSFSGSGTATVATPDEGTYQNPSAAEAGAAQ